MMLTEVSERIESITKRLKAIGGHWSVKVTTFSGQPPIYSVCHADTDGIPTSGSSDVARANVEFIAHASKDIEWLLEQNRMLAQEGHRALQAIRAVPCTCFAHAIPGQNDHTPTCPKKIAFDVLMEGRTCDHGHPLKYCSFCRERVIL